MSKSKVLKSLVIIQATGKKAAVAAAIPNSIVIATKGHFMMLSQKGLGIDLKNNFQPTYQIDPDKKWVVDDIKKIQDQVDIVYIMSDPDRQGQAIGVFAANLIKDKSKILRVTTKAIRQKQIQQAIANGRKIDMQMFQAFQARRCLDRICGFKSSFPIQTATGGKSAGRCQSPALRIVVQRQQQIQSFKPVTYFQITAKCKTKSGDVFEVNIKTPKSLDINDQDKAKQIVKYLNKNKIFVSKYDMQSKQSKPFAPFTTIQLQKACSTYLGWNPTKTMNVAQNCYQNLHISTYHRTDAPFIVSDVIKQIRGQVVKYGSQYLPSASLSYAAGGNSQQAHEACRPVDVSVRTTTLGGSDDQKLYQMIWKRTISSQMSNQKYDALSVQVSGKDNKYIFSTSGRRVTFDGFRKVWNYGNSSDVLLPLMAVGEQIQIIDAKYQECQTKPPSRFSETGMLDKLKQLGIGRPATFASIVDTIKQRGYVQLDGKALKATPLGIKVIDFMKNVNFKFVDYGFTSKMQLDLDLIALGKKTKVQVLQQFWDQLQKDLINAKNVKSINQKSTHKCPSCSKNGIQSFLLLKNSKFGAFYTCPLYNDKINKCQYKAQVGKNKQPIEKVKKVLNQSQHICAGCNMPLIIRQSKKDQKQYLGCRNFTKDQCKGFYNMQGVKNTPKTGAKKTFKKWGKKK